MPFLPKQWFWFVDRNKKARIVHAVGRQEADSIFYREYPDAGVLLTMPAEQCPHCNGMKPPMAGLIDGISYDRSITICKPEEDNHAQYMPVLGELSSNT